MTFEDFIDEWNSGGGSIEAFTSGSTGTPKRILLDKEFVRGSARRTISFFGIEKDWHLHSCVAPDFIGGKMMAVRALETGCRLTWEPPSNRPLSMLPQNDTVDLLAVVPSQMLHILEHLDQLPEIRNIIVGGSAINPALRERIAHSGLAAYESYGMTETASHIALRRIGSDDEWFSPLEGIRVMTDDRGCLAIEFESGERIVTNDLADTEDGRFRIMGRYDHVIVTGGRKVNPFEVEKKISDLIGSPFVISGVDDEKWGKRVILRIERTEHSVMDIGSEETRNDDEDFIRSLSERMRERLEPWEMPKEIVISDRLERTPNGKIRR